MKNSRKQNTSTAAAEDSQNGVPRFVKKNYEDSELPVFPEYYDPEFPAPRIMPSPDEDSYRSFVKSKLPQLKASQALRERIWAAIEHSNNAQP